MSDVAARVLITCPEANAPVDTVLRMRPSAFEALKGEYRFRCSKCGQVHTWSRDQAWLEARRPGRA